MPQIQLFDSVTGQTAEIDANRALAVGLPTDATDAGYVRMLDTEGKGISTTESGAVIVSQETVSLFEQVDGNALNTNVWTTSVSTLTVVQANGYITLNAAAGVNINSYAILSSIKYIALYGTLPLHVSINALVPQVPEANATVELGIGLCATTAAPTDGAFFRWNASGQFLAVVSSGGVETTHVLSGLYTDADGDTVTLPPVITDAEIYEIILVEDVVQFRVGDVLVAEVDVPAGIAYPTSSGRLPIFGRVYTGGTSPVVAPQLKIGQVVIAQQGMNQAKDWREIIAQLGRNSYQSPVTPFGQTANHTNSTNPSSATLLNTVAGYTTLGGRFQFAALAGAVTDYALFAYQVPAGYQLTIYRTSISCVNTGVANAVTATILDWALGINASAVSLATADGAGTWAPRRIPLGMQSFKVGDLVGQVTPDMMRTFDPPLVVDGGRYMHVILQIPIATGTVSQVIRGDVFIDGFFE